MTLRLAVQIAYVLSICLIVSSCGPSASATDGGSGREIVSMMAADGSPGRNVATGDAPSRVTETSEEAATGIACAAASDCATGFCVDGVCCDTACTESCRSCALSARPGICSPVIGAPDPGTCGGESSCGATGACGQTPGKACAAGGVCASGHCVDGVCCEQPNCGTCQACDLPGGQGSCAPLPALTADENAGCTGSSTCDGVGGCKQKNGAACSSAATCASGLCVDGLCCDDSCEGTCHSCAVPGYEGTCSVVAGQQDAVASTSCVGTNTCDALGSGTCKLLEGEACAKDSECAFGKCRTYYEDADGDGYGDVASADSRCDASPKPRAGEILVGGDCCDIDARVHPGQTLYRTARSMCKTYDYDCNGSDELKPDCAPPPYGSPVPGCGDPCMLRGGVPAGYIYAQSCR